MKRLLLALFLAASACATAAASTELSPAPVASDVVGDAPAASTSTCDERCQQKRHEELDRLLKLGTPAAVTVAQSH